MNLNSLKGESPVIDFENGVLGDAGIFAITGPTGSGKTTILDAIAVALYGRTPRLMNPIELMTRHTGECWAEIEFAVKAKVYRCRWSLRRSRGKADGKLQKPEMVLTDVSNDETIIEVMKSLVPKKVEELSGLDFSRFCRSVMLAQGNFAAFLNAKESERAELLEKMTGTGIYAEVSEQIYIKAKGEQEKLDRLESDLGVIDVLDEEACVLLKKEQVEAKAQHSKITNEHKTVTAYKEWLGDIAKLQEVFNLSAEELKVVKTERKNKSTQLSLLDHHVQAAKLRSELTLFNSAVAELSEGEQAQGLIDQRRIQVAATLKASKAFFTGVEQQFLSLRAEQESTEKIIPQVIELDTKLRQNEVVHKEIITAHDAGCADLVTLDTNQLAISSENDVAKAKLKKAQVYLEEHNRDKTLERSFSGIEEGVKQFSGVYGEITQNSISYEHAKQEVIDAVQVKNLYAVGINKSTKQRDDELKTKETLECERDVLLAGKALGDWESVVAHEVERKQQLQELIRLGTEGQPILDALNNEPGELKLFEIDLQKVAKQKTNVEKQVVELKKDLADLQSKRESEIKIANYEQARDSLVDDEACPLCGALDHPYATKKPLVGDTESRIVEKNIFLDTAEQDLRSADIQHTKLKSEYDSMLTLSIERKKQISQYRKSWLAIAEQARITCDPGQWDLVYDDLKSLDEYHEASAKRVTAIRFILDKIRDSSDLLASLEKELSESKLNAKDIDTSIAVATKNRETLKQNGLALELRYKKLQDGLTQQLGIHNVTIPKPGQEDLFITELTKRRNLYRDNFCVEGEGVRTLEQISLRVETVKKQIELKKTECHELEVKRISLTKSMKSDSESRVNIFGDQVVDFVQKRMRESEQKIALSLDEARKNILNAEKDNASVKSDVQAAVARIERAAEAKKVTLEDLSKKLIDTDFEDREAVQKALLDEDVYTELIELETSLAKRKVQAETRMVDSEQQILILKEKKLTDKSSENLLDELAILSDERSQLDRRIGELNAREKNHQKNVQQIQDKIKDIESQRRECARWNAMNTLIGSKDGKKFQKFAQGLTLEHLVRLANIHLVELSDRYMLQRADDADLEVMIIDTYQADTERSTKTLSGGESFLVSLSLALGLSQLSSRNVQVDSLFLDEGFGTLDPETLDVALSALHNIQACGKTVGVISHVEALKERIPVQIKVKRKSGGHSELIIVD